MLPSPRIAQSPLSTKYGRFVLYVFSWSNNEQDNVLALVNNMGTSNPLVRIQSACYTGEIFDSLDCDCHWQLEASLSAIAKEGGVFVYMLKDGRGAGLLAKIRGMALSAELGIDTADAYHRMGIELDPRNYEQAAYALRDLGYSAFRLLTNNPRKVDQLMKEGFKVQRCPLESVPTDANRGYLRAKATKLGHLMKTFGTDAS